MAVKCIVISHTGNFLASIKYFVIIIIIIQLALGIMNHTYLLIKSTIPTQFFIKHYIKIMLY